MSGASTPLDPFFRDPSTPPRRWEQYSRSPSPAPRPYPGPYETQGPSAAPPPRRNRSPPTLGGLEALTAVHPPEACLSCLKSIDFPCMIYRMNPCPKCHERARDCYVCGGSGTAVPRSDRHPRDCNHCAGSGKMAICNFCDGSLRVPCHLCSSRERRSRSCSNCRGRGSLRCHQCDNQGARLCPDCASSGWVGQFDQFCIGDVMRWPAPRGLEPRRHPRAIDVDRALWSRVELPWTPQGLMGEEVDLE